MPDQRHDKFSQDEMAVYRFKQRAAAACLKFWSAAVLGIISGSASWWLPEVIRVLKNGGKQ